VYYAFIDLFLRKDGVGWKIRGRVRNGLNEIGCTKSSKFTLLLGTAFLAIFSPRTRFNILWGVNRLWLGPIEKLFE